MRQTTLELITAIADSCQSDAPSPRNPRARDLLESSVEGRHGELDRIGFKALVQTKKPYTGVFLDAVFSLLDLRGMLTVDRANDTQEVIKRKSLLPSIGEEERKTIAVTNTFCGIKQTSFLSFFFFVYHQQERVCCCRKDVTAGTCIAAVVALIYCTAAHPLICVCVPGVRFVPEFKCTKDQS